MTPGPSRPWWRHPLAAPAVIGAVAYGGMVVADRVTGTLRAGTTPTTIGQYLLGVIAYGMVALTVLRRPDLPAGLRSVLWLAPIGYRFALLATEPTLSDDVYRYLWDGHLLSQGVNPYRHAIAAQEVDGFTIAARDLANNPDLASPYLPTAQLLFLVLAVVAPSVPLAVQAVMVASDLAAAAVLQRLLGRAGLPPARVALFLWHPLTVVETAHGAHFDALLTALTLFAFLSVLPGGGPPGDGPPEKVPPGDAPGGDGPTRLLDRARSPLALALATLTRPVPALLAPVLFWRWTWHQRLGFGVLLIVAVLPFRIGAGSWGLFGPPTGTGVFGSARVYSAEFRFNAVVAERVERWLIDLFGTGDAFTPVVSAFLAVVLLGVLAAARPRRSRPGDDTAIGFRRTLRLASVPLAAYAVLTPVLHPWYLVLPVAMAVFLVPGAGESRRWWLAVAPLGWLSVTVVFSYLTYRDPANFAELTWVRRLQWWPALGLAVAGLAALVHARSGRRRPRSPRVNIR
ncbi:MAG: hypothetical protein AAF547_07080 [Actinomycetota bacterium]